MGCSCSGSACNLCSTIDFGALTSKSLRLLRECAAANNLVAATVFVGSVLVADGVRWMTEQRTTGSGDGDRDGFGGGVSRTVSSRGNGSFSLISFGVVAGGGRRRCDSFSGLFGVGYDLRWACVRTWPIAPYGIPPPSIDDMNRPLGRSVGSVVAADRFNEANSVDVLLERSVFRRCSSPNMSRSTTTTIKFKMEKERSRRKKTVQLVLRYIFFFSLV